MSSDVDKFLESEGKLTEAISNMYEATSVELLGEEKFVYDGLLMGVSKADLAKEVQRRHPTYPKKITSKDIDWFLKRNPDVAEAVIEKSNALLKRQADVYLNHELALAQMYQKSTNVLTEIQEHPEFDVRRDGYLIKEYLKLISEIVLNDAKVRGRFAEKQVTNINMKAREIINQTVAAPNDFQKEIMEKLNKVKEETIVDADFEVKDDGVRKDA